MDRIAQLAEKKEIIKARNFVESAWFIVAFAAAILLLYVLNLPVVALGVFAICGIFICLFCEDTRPGLVLVFLIMLSFRYKYGAGAYTSIGAIIFYIVAAPPLVAAVIYRLVKCRVPFKSEYGLFSVVIFSIAFLTGGFFSAFSTWENLYYTLGKAASLSGCYLFFAYTLKNREDNFVYIAKVFAASVCVIALQVAEIYIRKYRIGTPLDAVWKAGMVFGWSISNMVAEMIVFGLPAVFYLIYKEERGYLYWIVVAVGMIAVYFTFGRNALLWGGITTVAGSIINCLAGKNKKINRMIVFGALAAVLCLFIIFCLTGYIQKIARFFLDVKFDDRERFEVWERHIRLFAKNPIYGVGFTAYHNYDVGYWQHTAHNIWLQMLTSSGLVGFALFMFHHVWTLTLIGKKPTLDRIFIFGCLLVGILMSIVSPLFYGVYFMIPYAALLVILEKSKPKRTKQEEKE